MLNPSVISQRFKVVYVKIMIKSTNKQGKGVDTALNIDQT